MNKLIVILCLLFAVPVFAQNQEAIYQEAQHSANELRSHKREIRAFFMQLVLRKVQIDVADSLSQSKMSEEEIQKVLTGEAMQHFLSNLEQNPNIRKKVDEHVEKFLKPGVIEAQVMKQYETQMNEIQQQTIITQHELQMTRHFVPQEHVFVAEEDQSLTSKIWDHLMKDLLKQ